MQFSLIVIFKNHIIIKTLLMKILFFAILGTLLFWSCTQNPNHSHQADDKHQSATDQEDHETDAVTLYSASFEVFTEFDVLRVGHEAEFLIHVTQLDADYSAYTAGNVKVILNIDDKKQIKIAEQASVVGIYTLTLIPENSGFGSLVFDITLNSISEKLTADHVHVYEENNTDYHQHGSAVTGLIKFTKEQAWNSKFNVTQIKPDSFSQVITASGEFLSMPGEKQNVIAKSQGIVLFAKKNLVQGKYVSKGEELFTLSGQGLADNNIMIRFSDAKINYQQSKSNLERHQALLQEKIISDKQYLETRSKYEADSILYFSLKETVSSSGMKITAPKSGYIHELNVSEGQFVEPGNLMATISTNKILLLRADVPQQYFNELAKITTTHFRPAYTTRVYTLEELSGKLIARGASVAENNHYMPVYFEVVNDGTILEGAFAEFYLKTNPEPGKLVIPVTALIEEQGNYYVYVQVSGEEFQKRSVTLTANDGINVSVSSGLNFGERIVSEGPMLIKMATSAGIPVHSHEH